MCGRCEASTCGGRGGGGGWGAPQPSAPPTPSGAPPTCTHTHKAGVGMHASHQVKRSPAGPRPGKPPMETLSSVKKGVPDSGGKQAGTRVVGLRGCVCQPPVLCLPAARRCLPSHACRTLPILDTPPPRLPSPVGRQAGSLAGSRRSRSPRVPLQCPGFPASASRPRCWAAHAHHWSHPSGQSQKSLWKRVLVCAHLLDSPGHPPTRFGRHALLPWKPRGPLSWYPTLPDAPPPSDSAACAPPVAACAHAGQRYIGAAGNASATAWGGGV